MPSPFDAIAYRLDFSLLAREVFGFNPDPWQKAILQNPYANHCLTTSRQIGKTEAVTAVVAAATLLGHPANDKPTSVILSTGRDHAVEVLRRVMAFINLGVKAGLGKIKEQNKSSVTLASGARVLSLPSTERVPRGWVVPTGGLLCIDEAAFVEPAVFEAAFPLAGLAYSLR